MNIAVIDKGEKTQYSALLKTHQKTLIRLNSAAVARFLQGTEKVFSMPGSINETQNFGT